jgi:hypothetical protein
MIKLTDKWYIQWPFRKPWGKWVDIDIELTEKIYNAVTDAMIQENRGTALECSYCRKKVAYVVILKKYENFPVLCQQCLVGE